VSDVEYLDLEDLLQLTSDLKAGPVRDLGLLDSAAARPRASAFGADAYSTVDLKAAASLHSIARNHALVDGNKRLAWVATVVFLDINHHTTGIEEDAAFALVMDVAAGNDDLDDIARRLLVVPV
jgi:death on curing protein